MGRVVWMHLEEPDDPEDLTQYPGGWQEGELVTMQIESGDFTFEFTDTTGECWRVSGVRLHAEDYDPYDDPMSADIVNAWYVMAE